VGGGHAAEQLISSLVELGCDSIDLFCDEPFLPYQRPPLSKQVLLGEIGISELIHVSEDWYKKHGVHVHLSSKVEEIDVVNQKLILANTEYYYQKLVLATGSCSRKLTLPGSDLEGIHYLKSLMDAQSFKQKLSSCKRLVIVGGGYIGLEVAACARQFDIQVSVVECNDQLLSRVASKPMANYLQQHHINQGVQIKCNAQVVKFTTDNQGLAVTGVSLADGTILNADLVLVGIGSEANDQLAIEAGIECKQGVVVDSSLRSSADNVLAIGDCSQFHSDLYDHWMRLECIQNAQEQAVVAAQVLMDENIQQQYNPVPRFWSEQYHLRILMAGAAIEETQDVVRGSLDSGDFCVYRLANDGRLLAVESPNRSKEVAFGARLISQKAVLNPDRILDEGVHFKKLALH
jgi:3-phenylpropionate/trans-cinnamate dioxygenase ferredoxin reductase subunit